MNNSTGFNFTEDGGGSVGSKTDWSWEVFRLGSSAIALFGIIGNFFVIFLMLRNPVRRARIPNMLIINQSFLDIVTSIFIVIDKLGVNGDKTIAISGIVLKETYCRLWRSQGILWSSMTGSTFNLCVISFERYLAIVWPFKHSRMVTKGRIKICIVFTWLLSFFIKLASIIPVHEVDEKVDICRGWVNWPSLQVQQIVGIFIIFIEYLNPLIFMIYCYVHMTTRIIRQTGSATNGVQGESSGNKSSEERERRMQKAGRNLFKTLLIVAIAFVICNSPSQIYFLLLNGGVKLKLGALYRFFTMTYFINAVINPILYTVQYEEFQKELKKLFCPKALTRDDSETENSKSSSYVTNQTKVN